MPSPPGGRRFESVFLPPEGWVVLSPWILTPDGHWYRLHVCTPGAFGGAREWADHTAAQLNDAIGEARHA